MLLAEVSRTYRCGAHMDELYLLFCEEKLLYLKLRVAPVGHIVRIYVKFVNHRPGDGNFIVTRFSRTVSS